MNCNCIVKNKKYWCLMVSVGTCLGLLYIQFSKLRQSAVRLAKLVQLNHLFISATLFKETNGRFPEDLKEIYKIGELSDDDMKCFVYLGGKRGVMAYQKEPCRAVNKGEPWGDPGERARCDYPAVRMIWLDNEKPKSMEESEFQEKYGFQ